MSDFLWSPLEGECGLKNCFLGAFENVEVSFPDGTVFIFKVCEYHLYRYVYGCFFNQSVHRHIKEGQIEGEWK